MADFDDPNKLHHIFGNPDHNLGSLVLYCGNEEAVAKMLITTVTAAFLAGPLLTDTRGHYKQVFNIGGHPVCISGRVVGGSARIGSAWIAA